MPIFLYKRISNWNLFISSTEHIDQPQPTNMFKYAVACTMAAVAFANHAPAPVYHPAPVYKPAPAYKPAPHPVHA